MEIQQAKQILELQKVNGKQTWGFGGMQQMQLDHDDDDNDKNDEDYHDHHHHHCN